MSEQQNELRTIQDTNAYLRSLVETPQTVKDYFWIGGIVTFVYTSHLGHTYFTITDEQHSISCMLSNRVRDKSVYVTKGTMIDVYGVLQVYQKEAKLQMMVSDIRLVELDESTLDATVIEKLESQGLFPRTKRDLPKNPRHIALITSKSSEALRDFENVYREQNGQAAIQLVDTILQGEQAVNLIVQRIEETNHDAKADIIVLTRGGGRNEDMSTFNSFEVAEAICKSKIPIVTGIGHQRDETIADRVADQATISPTDAAYKLAQLSQNDRPSQATAFSKSSEEPISNVGSQAQNNSMMLFIVIALLIIIVGLIIFVMLLLQS